MYTADLGRWRAAILHALTERGKSLRTTIQDFYFIVRGGIAKNDPQFLVLTPLFGLPLKANLK